MNISSLSSSTPRLSDAIQDRPKLLFPDENSQYTDAKTLYKARIDDLIESPMEYFTPRQTIRRNSTVSMIELGQTNNEKEEEKETERVVRSRKTDEKRHKLDEYLDVAKLKLAKMSQQLNSKPRLNLSSRNLAASLSSLNNDNRVQFHLSQTPPMSSGAPPCIQAQTLSPVLHSFTKDLLSLSNTGMPRSYDPSRSALLKKGAPRVSISVDDISAQTWNTTRNGNPAANSNAGGLLWPVPQFYLQPPSMGSSRAASPQPSIQHPPNPADGPDLRHRGELDMAEKYNYDLSKAQLKASSRTSALLAGFAMVALVELQYDEYTPRPLLILLGVITSLLVSVHLLALMMSTCILPYMEATGCTQDSPHLRLKFYIDLSWLFSTCIGLLLFLVEIGIIFFVKFDAVGYRTAGYITTAMLIPVVVIFIVFSYLIHKSRVSHSLGRFKHKVDTMKQFLDVEAQMPKTSMISPVKDI